MSCSCDGVSALNWLITALASELLPRHISLSCLG